MNKKFYQSRTLWIGALEVISGIAAAIAGEIATGSTLTIAGILTILLRFITKSAIIK